MLCQFSFSNFKSFRDKVTINMAASSIDEHSDSKIIDKDKKEFLPIAAIYGPNGGGKSSVIEAFDYMISFVMRPILTLSESENSINHDNSTESFYNAECSPFAFDDISNKQPTIFDVIFRVNNTEFAYHISILNRVVMDESLIKTNVGGKRSAIIFYRENNIITNGAIIKEVKQTSIAKQMPYLSFLFINYSISIIITSIKWFVDTLVNNKDLKISNYKILNSTFIQAIEKLNDEQMDVLLSILKSMDIPISGIETIDNNGQKMMITKHIISGKSFTLDLSLESMGTQKLLNILPRIIKMISSGDVAFVDELDSKLHPKLLEFIISLFTNKEINKAGAQIIHTSHDLTTLRNDLYRRDEIWFAARNDNGVSELYSLVEFRDDKGLIIRPDAAFNKQYLAGRYGADPYLTTMLKWPGTKNE